MFSLFDCISNSYELFNTKIELICKYFIIIISLHSMFHCNHVSSCTSYLTIMIICLSCYDIKYFYLIQISYAQLYGFKNFSCLMVQETKVQSQVELYERLKK